MALGDIKLGLLGSEELMSGFGRSFSISDNEFSRTERTAGCRLIKDIKDGSPKKQFTLSYETIDGDELFKYLNLYDNEEVLSLLYYTDIFTFNQYNVIMEPIDRERIFLLNTGLWGGVSIVLNEV